MSFQERIDRYLDKLLIPRVLFHGRSWPAFQVFGYTGLSLAVLLTMALVTSLGLSLWVMTGITLSAMGVFLALVMATKIITGKEQIIYYHHEIAVLSVTAILLKLLHQPMLPYLDITILGIGLFLVCGRVGCLMVGCCHGRPNKWGVCYRKEHADSGFTHYYVGVRLFPIQALESLWVLVIVIVGAFFLLGKQPPGETLAWYVITYGLGRFCFEFVRGDPERPYYSGFSEAQWTSLLLMFAVLWWELAGTLLFHLWHIVATAGVALSMIAVVLTRRFRGAARHRLLSPRHVREFAEAIDLISNRVSERTVFTGKHTVPEIIPMYCTSLDIQISAGKIRDAETAIDHYALSSQKETMNKEIASTLADLIIRLKHPDGLRELVSQNQGVFHVLIRPITVGDQK